MRPKHVGRRAEGLEDVFEAARVQCRAPYRKVRYPFLFLKPPGFPSFVDAQQIFGDICTGSRTHSSSLDMFDMPPVRISRW